MRVILTYLSLSSTDCPSSTLTADAFVVPSTEAESGSVIEAIEAAFDPPVAIEIFTFVVVVVLGIGAIPPLITGAHDVLTVFVFGAGPIRMNSE